MWFTKDSDWTAMLVDKLDIVFLNESSTDVKRPNSKESCQITFTDYIYHVIIAVKWVMRVM